MWLSFLAVGVGSALGGIARYGANVAFDKCGILPSMLATFTVNVAGCFLLGILSALITRTGGWNPTLKLLLTVGFCGGFTTFSTFINENFQLMQAGNFMNLMLYTSVSVVAGFIMLWLGYWIVSLR